MNSENAKSLSAVTELRLQAEKQLQSHPVQLNLPGSAEESLRLLHELQVHQIELEMQNEELRQSRDLLETALDKYTDLYDFAPVGYVTLDSNAIIRTVNLTAAGLFGIERASLIGAPLGGFVADESRQVFTEFIVKVFSSPDKISCEVRFATTGNSPLFVLLEAVAFESGQECRVALIDISEHKRAEEEINRLNTDVAARAAELEIANRDLESFSYTVSNDLLKSLMTIGSYARAIQDYSCSKADDKCINYAKRIYERTKHLAELISIMNDFFRPMRIDMHREVIDLSEMVRKTAEKLQTTKPDHRVTFRIADGITIDADRNMLQMAVNILLGNAWKHTGKREEPVIECGIMEIKGMSTCFVRDNGTGFDMAHADMLFKPFQPLPGTEDDASDGIGLATVDRIIRRHGGKLWAEGAPDKGATFYFTLSTDRRSDSGQRRKPYKTLERSLCGN